MIRDLFSMNGHYSRIMNWLWNVLVINILWVLCCLPVFTIGVASTAAYYAMAKCVRHNTGKVVSEFFSSFRANFKQAFLLTLILGFVLTAVLLECIYLYSNPSVPLVFLYLFYFMTAMVAACAIYTWPCLSRFHKGTIALLQMGMILVFRHLLTTVLLLLFLFITMIGVYLMPWGILIFPGLMLYLQSFLMEKVLLRYSPKPTEEEEASKWYYQ